MTEMNGVAQLQNSAPSTDEPVCRLGLVVSEHANLETLKQRYPSERLYANRSC
jgi:hypothetical protein